jgi:hypothetical protein
MARTTVIPHPSLGLLNLLGEPAAALVEQDRRDLTPIFKERIEMATQPAPRCDVLFLYCNLDAQARVVAPFLTLRELIRRAGARIAVVASDIPKQDIANPHFAATLGANNTWPANIAITLDRGGAYFGRFFVRLFSMMQDGTDMLTAWVEIAPQGPDQPSDPPVMFMVPEAGAIAFGPQAPAN